MFIVLLTEVFNGYSIVSFIMWQVSINFHVPEPVAGCQSYPHVYTPLMPWLHTAYADKNTLFLEKIISFGVEKHKES